MNLSRVPWWNLLDRDFMVRQVMTNETSEYEPTFWESASHCKAVDDAMFGYLRRMKNEW